MREIQEDVIAKVKVLLGIVVVLWIIEIANLILGYQLNNFGIVPRSYIGLRGVIFAPFLHGSVQHLIVNTVPFLVLGFFVIARGFSAFVALTCVIAIMGGLGVWIFGRPASNHIGASGLIFGYFGFLVFKGVFDRKAVALLVSGIVLMVYGGMIWGVLPGRMGVSWESHLFGFIAGVSCAYFSRHKKNRDSSNV